MENFPNLTVRKIGGFVSCPPSPPKPQSTASALVRVSTTPSRTLRNRIDGLVCRLERTHEFKDGHCVVCQMPREKRHP